MHLEKLYQIPNNTHIEDCPRDLSSDVQCCTERVSTCMSLVNVSREWKERRWKKRKQAGKHAYGNLSANQKNGRPETGRHVCCFFVRRRATCRFSASPQILCRGSGSFSTLTERALSTGHLRPPRHSRSAFAVVAAVVAAAWAAAASSKRHQQRTTRRCPLCWVVFSSGPRVGSLLGLALALQFPCLSCLSDQVVSEMEEAMLVLNFVTDATN